MFQVPSVSSALSANSVVVVVFFYLFVDWLKAALKKGGTKHYYGRMYWEQNNECTMYNGWKSSLNLKRIYDE